ncbi:plasmodesmata-located protein 6-like [Phoenix dactylifera]|uniref:Plasmodesmata-located protein 6-like n=1 Tax=Phoenix dactylifera TaxID=42345 RepID=A0A8B7BM00_PHODC|nr:plasmodesmata-located protein 6-like [Phoenix dactylifera]
MEIISPLSSPSLLLLYSLLLSAAAAAAASSGDDSTLVYAACSNLKYDPNSPYQSNLNSLLASFANAAALSTYSNFSSSFAGSVAPILGLYQCRSDLSLPDCASCVRSALPQLSALCPSATAATLQLRACFLRYGNDSFLGRPDNSLAFKRCGPAATSDHTSTMSDMALSSLAAPGEAVGPFRLGVAGHVRGAAQCVGDLSPEDCGTCLADAVGQLRADCDDAESGDLYLGKCYARFWSGEGDDSSSAHRRWLYRALWLLSGVAVANI